MNYKKLWRVADTGNGYTVIPPDEFDPEDCLNVVATYTTSDAAWDRAERMNRFYKNDEY